MDDLADGVDKQRDALADQSADLGRKIIELLNKDPLSEPDILMLRSYNERRNIIDQGLEIIGRAKSNTTTIHNEATQGSCLQILVSTNGKTIHGANKANGSGMSYQLGGYYDGDTVIAFAKDVENVLSQIEGPQGRYGPLRAHSAPPTSADHAFDKLWGSGVPLGEGPDENV